MKTDIVTVFKTHNCGSFLQAWALKEKLSEMGNEVRFCDYRPSVNALSSSIKNAVKCCLKFRFKRAASILEKTMAFKSCQKSLKTVQPEKDVADAYFFGSDTLWNFSDIFFSKQADFFTGKDIKKPCYAYSMSVGSTSKEVFVKHTQAIENIRKFKKIAVRDEHCRNLLSDFYPDGNMVSTVDPTLLIDKDTYIRNFSNPQIQLGKYLLMYYFGEIPQSLWKEILRFSQKNDLKIVYMGFHEKQYDVCLTAKPDNFITAFANAEYVFTNTFHGCVFSTIFNKQFVTDGIYKKKIEGFLEEFSLLDRVVTTAEDVEKVLTTPVNYDNVNNLVSEARQRSIDYLQSVIDEVKGNE